MDVGLPHPFHLHGRPFYIVARGSGSISEKDLANIDINTNNPLRRDTLFVPSAAWVVLRLITDTPGVWALHCHIGWHLSEGKVRSVDFQD